MDCLSDPAVIEEVRYWLHRRPRRKESLIARIEEINLEISELLRVKAHYETELEKELRDEQN